MLTVLLCRVELNNSCRFTDLSKFPIQSWLFESYLSTAAVGEREAGLACPQLGVEGYGRLLIDSRRPETVR